jgi:hypothetical protein
MNVGNIVSTREFTNLCSISIHYDLSFKVQEMHLHNKILTLSCVLKALLSLMQMCMQSNILH